MAKFNLVFRKRIDDLFNFDNFWRSRIYVDISEGLLVGTMVKKKGNREMNPMDSFRKSQRSKEVAKNKKERQLQREAMSHVSDPSYLRQQLKEILDEEQAGPLHAAQRSRKKTLQTAYSLAVKKKMEDAAAKSSIGEVCSTSAVPIAGIPLPPMPPPGIDIQSIPLPPMPPSNVVGLPPPVVGPSNVPPLPLFTTGMEAGILPPPLNPPAEHRHVTKKEHDTLELTEKISAKSVIAARSTVVPLPKAHLDRNVISMVPASVQTARKYPSKSKPSVKGPLSGGGFGLIPRSISSKSQSKDTSTVPDNFDDFMKNIKQM
eukprot:jgi/Picsp_1/4851/NSC_02216-R1_proline-rich family protein